MMDNHPKSATLLREWFTDRLIESIEDMEEFQQETAEIMKQHLVSNEAVSNIILDNVRSLFDFFDDNQLFINIVYDFERKVFKTNYETEFSSRKEAEMSAINEAFKALEAIL